MTRKLDDSAFAYYLGLGPGRSHKAVGNHYGCSKKAVTNKAIAEDWKGKLADYEREQREKAERKASESLEAMNERQLKVLAFIQGKSIETLKAVPMDTAMEAVRAYTMAVQQERLIRGQPSTRTVIDLEQKIRAEHENWAPQEDNEPEPGDPSEKESDGEGAAAAPAV